MFFLGLFLVIVGLSVLVILGGRAITLWSCFNIIAKLFLIFMFGVVTFMGISGIILSYTHFTNLF